MNPRRCTEACPCTTIANQYGRYPMTQIFVPASRRLVTAEITYRLPDFRNLLQLFIWQSADDVPECPRLQRFLEFWSANIEGRLHEVNVKWSERSFGGLKVI